MRFRRRTPESRGGSLGKIFSQLDFRTISDEFNWGFKGVFYLRASPYIECVGQDREMVGRGVNSGGKFNNGVVEGKAPSSEEG